MKHKGKPQYLKMADKRKIAKMECEDVTQATAFLATGYENRAVAKTSMNAQSSRSHCILTFYVNGVNESTGATYHTELNHVDLAGAERINESQVSVMERTKETIEINKSLGALRAVECIYP